MIEQGMEDLGKVMYGDMCEIEKNALHKRRHLKSEKHSRPNSGID